MSKEYDEGYNAFADGERLADNPYDKDSHNVEHNDWRTGFEIAQSDRKEFIQSQSTLRDGDFDYEDDEIDWEDSEDGDGFYDEDY